MTTPQVAWVTRHPPTLEQRRSLGQYVIRQPAFCRFQRPEELWQAALDITHGHPAVIVVIVPAWLMNGVASLAHIRMGVPVIRPHTPEWGEWTGVWTQSILQANGGFEWRRWLPEGADDAYERSLQERTGQPEPRRWRQDEKGWRPQPWQLKREDNGR